MTIMSRYTVTLTITVRAKNEDDAIAHLRKTFNDDDSIIDGVLAQIKKRKAQKDRIDRSRPSGPGLFFYD